MTGLRIVSWNVNGIRSVGRQGFVEWFEKERPDVCLLQEVRADHAQWPEGLLGHLADEDGYELVSSIAQKKGYSGTSVLVRKGLRARLGGGSGTGSASPSHLDFLHPVSLNEGRFCGVRLGERLIVASAYFPNSQRGGARLPAKLEFCEALLAQLQRWRSEGTQVVLGGDYNIAHTELDLANPKSNVKNAGFLPEERAWMTRFLEAGWVDSFRLFTQGNGHYTWWSNLAGVRERNIGWRIDYIAVNAELKGAVRKAQIHAQTLGSDHCPVSVLMDL